MDWTDRSLLTELPELERHRLRLRDRLGADLASAERLIGEQKAQAPWRRDQVPPKILWAINASGPGAAFAARITYADLIAARAHLRAQARLVADNGEIAGLLGECATRLAAIERRAAGAPAGPDPYVPLLNLRGRALQAARAQLAALEDEIGMTGLLARRS